MAACSGPVGSSVVSATPSQPADAPPSGTIAASNNARVFSLLANNHLLVADIMSGAVLVELTLAAPAPVPSGVHGMALDRDGRTLFVLVTGANERATIATVDTATLQVAATLDPGASLEYHGLAIGPRTGRLYLFANHGGDAVVRILDPVGRQEPQTWLAHASGGRTWRVYQGAVTADESALYLSYHGPDTTGIDRFEIQPIGLLRCNIVTFPDSGCLRTHGSFALHDGALIAATGDSPVLALDPVSGARRGEYDLKLEGNHLTEFGIAGGIGRLFAVGSCGYTGGLATVDLASHQTHLLAPSRTAGVICGERIAALGDGSLLVVAKTAIPAPSLAPGALVVLSSDGKTLRTIKTSAEPIDLLLF
jgi:hypothetical protein